MWTAWICIRVETPDGDGATGVVLLRSGLLELLLHEPCNDRQDQSLARRLDSVLESAYGQHDGLPDLAPE